MSFIPIPKKKYKKCKLCNNGNNCGANAKKNGVCLNHYTLLNRMGVDTTKDIGKLSYKDNLSI